MYRVLVCLFVLSFGFSISAQDNPTTPKLFINVTLNTRATNPEFTPGTSIFADEILTSLDEFFAASEFEVVFLTDNTDLAERMPIFGNRDDYPDAFAPKSPIMLVNIDTYGKTDAIQLTSYAAFSYPPLPVGTFGWTVVFIIGEDNTGTVEDVVHGVAAIGGYVAHDCEFALPYINAILEEDKVIQEGILIAPGYHFYEGGCAYQTGDVETAIRAYRAVRNYRNEADKKDIRLYSLNAAINLAWIYIEQGENTEALDVLDNYTDVEYVSFTGREMSPALAKIAVYIQLEAYDSAFAAFDNLIMRITDHPENFTTAEQARIYTERGKLNAQLEKFDAALADYEQAIEIDPAYPKVYYYRALLAEAQGKRVAARDDYNQFIDLSVDFFSYYEEDLTPYLEQAKKATNR